MPSKKAKIVLISIAGLLLMGGCSSLVSGMSGGVSKGLSERTASPAVTPTDESSSSVLPEPPGSSVFELSPAQIAMANDAMEKPVKVVAGSYLKADGYRFFDTLTELKLDSGKRVYFATDGGKPFPDGFVIAANQESRDLTGFGEKVPATGPAGLDAAKMLADHGAELD